MELCTSYKGGGSFVKLSPQFSNDGQNLFMCSKESILQYNTKTAKLIHAYKTSSLIIGFSYHFYESYYCITACTKEGKITTWKTETHCAIAQKKLPNKNIQTFHIVPHGSENYKAVYSYCKKQFVHFALWEAKNKKSTDFKLVLKDMSNFFIDVNNTNYFAVAQDKRVYFIRLNNFKSFSRSFISDGRKFTCIALHPSEEIVLTGDSTGRVIGWHNIFSEESKQNIFHWHTLPVQTVSFSKSGSYFYSGGGECVLVKWQYDNFDDRRFVPRIPGEINHVVVANNNLFVAMATNDNSVRVLDNTLNQISLIQHLVLAKHFDSGIVHDARSKALILNGNYGHIQFYSPEDMSLMYSVDITGQNRITNERETTMINTEITKVAISHSGLWFATVEERKDKEYSAEIRLKFWKFDESKQQFVLNTSIEYPHEDSVNSMLFQPHKDDSVLQCITIGDDRKFKIWQLSETDELSGTQLSWKCFSVGFFRDLPCKALSFSVDGTLFATGFKDILTVWTPDTCLLKCSLLHPLHKQKLNHIQFGYGNQCHLLVAASRNQMSVWNILTLSMIWTVPISVSFLIADSLSVNMAVITRDKKVFVFSPNSSEPLYVNAKLLTKFESIKACNFIPSKNINDPTLSWYERTQLYILTSEKELYCINESDVTLQLMLDEPNNGKSTFNMIQPKVKSNSIHSANLQKHLYKKDLGQETIKTYLESPLHTLAPIRYACHSLLKSLVIQEDS